MRKFQLASGKVIEFNLATIEQALDVYRAVLNECKNAGLDLSIYEGDTVFDVIMKNKEAVLNIFSSKEVMETIKVCCEKLLYDGKRFSMDIFEEEKAREDFIGVIVVVGVENLRPFFSSLRLFLDQIASLFLRA